MSLTNFFEDNILKSGNVDVKDSKVNIEYPLSKLAANEWLGFAMYTIESRAIPNMIDGFKPVQRFYVYSSIKNTPKDFKKVSAVAGIISDYGYNHGESSAAGAGQLMASEWNNNVCLVEGRGSFGTRLVQAAAAARYTYTRLHPNFHIYMKDLDLSPKHEDPEHEPPAFYVPIIPLVLVNGIRGIATGFATNILPRDPVDIARACKEYVETGKFSARVKVKFPQFSGTVHYNETEDRYYCTGFFEKKSKTQLSITEVPYGFDRESYIKVLDDLEEEGEIVGYDDLCDKSGFRFDVKLKQNDSANWSDEKIITKFKLSKVYSENLTVIDQNGKLREYTNELDLIRDFCDFRNEILQKRIDLRIKELTEEARWLSIKMAFIQAVLDNRIIFKNRKKDDVGKQILSETFAISEDVDRLLRINIMSLTDELVKALAKQIEEIKKDLKFWKTTTVKDQFLSDLSELK